MLNKDKNSLSLVLGSVLFCIFAFSNSVAYLIFLGQLPPIRLTVIYIILSILILAKFAIDFMRYWPNVKLTFYEITGWMLLAWIAILHFVWYPEIVRAGGTEEFWKNAAHTLLLTVLMWSTGLAVGRGFNKAHRISFIRVLLLVTFLVLGATILWGVLIGQKDYGEVVFYFWNSETRHGFNYLVLADTLALCGLLLMGTWQSAPGRQLLTYFLACLFLFFSFSRAAFYLFVFWGAIHLGLSLRRFGSAVYCVSVLLLLLTLTLLGIYGTGFKNVKAVERMASLITELRTDPSFQTRQILLREGVEVLHKNWLLGNYMAEWRETGSLGGYIHNWLSFLVAYGIGPFSLFIFLTLFLLAKGYLLLRRGTGPTPVVLLLFAFSAIALARSYVWHFVWFSLGFVVAYTRDVHLKGGAI